MVLRSLHLVMGRASLGMLYIDGLAAPLKLNYDRTNIL